MAKDFLLEIGLEEVPAKFAPMALTQLEENGRKKLAELRLDYTGLKAYASPRRLALLITQMSGHQAELNTEVKGPAVKAAYDGEGNPTKALQGFARAQGVELTDLFTQELNGVPYVYARKQEKGQPTEDLLSGFCLEIIQSLQFPKPMRWGDLDVRFARPIRWLVSLYGQDVVDFQFAGLNAGRLSRGHRTLSQGPVGINTPGEYVDSLRKAFVLVDQEERQEKIWSQIQALALGIGGKVPDDEELLEEITHIVEYPTALLGNVDEKYMHLPEEVITTPMKEHQRYFPVYAPGVKGSSPEAGKLLPYFITVRNGDERALDQVREGNEKVLKARLEDAAFYYREDLKTPLIDLISKLYKIVYHEKLGTVGDRVERLCGMAGLITEFLGLEAVESMRVDRTALLAKTDLVTMMVYDFPELQGVMGAEYARVGGEEPEVCQGILEHYQPRFAGDALPASNVGRVVSIADKLDAIVGSFGIGIQPTGSQDPYALRRQAQGIVNMLLDAEWDLSINTLIGGAHKFYIKFGISILDLNDVRGPLLDFFQQRLRFALQEQGFRYDVIDAVISREGTWPYRALKRARVLAEKRNTPEFVPYAQAYVRCHNLIKKQEHQYWKPEALIDPAEVELAAKLREQYNEFNDLTNRLKYDQAYELAAQLVPLIEKLFESVMIMVDDEAVKAARLGLLAQCTDRLGCLGDLSLLV